MHADNNMAARLFQMGVNDSAYEYFGVHLEQETFVFRVWAPRAKEIHLIGDFNSWRSGIHKMQPLGTTGVWEIQLPSECIAWGDKYKYRINGENGVCDKADPFGVATECPPATASVVYDLSGYAWRDDGWLRYRKAKVGKHDREPMNVYEIHVGSWKRHDDGRPYSYVELATELAPYLKQMGYTHVELLPVTEHMAEESFGYRGCSYFSPSARYGTPKDFMAFVDSMHEAGIGVFMDWVPSYFSSGGHGLIAFDGQPLFETRREEGFRAEGSDVERFDLTQKEVESFLISSASFWLKQYHIDGLRISELSSMIRLADGRIFEEWAPNVYGDNRYLEGISFLRKLNSHIKKSFPDVLTIADGPTAKLNGTTFGHQGLGFDMMWNVGWTHDTLAYAELDPIWRKYHHEKMTFSLVYAFGEKYMLPISHDQMIQGKKSYLDKMSGDYWQKFASARAFFGYMMTHPGKKLLFMGAEIGQFREWDCRGEIEWFLLEYESHAKMQKYVSELNHFYLAQPALWQTDDSWDGFHWIDADNRKQSILSYRRVATDGRELIVLINFTPVVYEDFRLGVPLSGSYEEIFNSDDPRFGGSGVVNTEPLKSEAVAWNYLPQSVRLRVPPLGMTILRNRRKTKKQSDKG